MSQTRLTPCRFGMHRWSTCHGGWHGCHREGCDRTKACTWRCVAAKPAPGNLAILALQVASIFGGPIAWRMGVPFGIVAPIVIGFAVAGLIFVAGDALMGRRRC